MATQPGPFAKTSATAMVAACACLLTLGCGASAAPAPGGTGGSSGVEDALAMVDADEPAGSPQLPPRGRARLEAWLAAGWHRAWRCEAAIAEPRLTGNHGRHRVCSNDALLASTAGPYPVGAAAVKELFLDLGGTRPNGFAVGIKVEAGEGPQTWYWYERRGTDPGGPLVGEGTGNLAPQCAVCHGMAARDNIFIRAD